VINCNYFYWWYALLAVIGSELAQKNYFIEKKDKKPNISQFNSSNGYLHDIINDSFSHKVELAKFVIE